MQDPGRRWGRRDDSLAASCLGAPTWHTSKHQEGQNQRGDRVRSKGVAPLNQVDPAGEGRAAIKDLWFPHRDSPLKGLAHHDAHPNRGRLLQNGNEGDLQCGCCWWEIQPLTPERPPSASLTPRRRCRPGVGMPRFKRRSRMAAPCPSWWSACVVIRWTAWSIWAGMGPLPRSPRR